MVQSSQRSQTLPFKCNLALQLLIQVKFLEKLIKLGEIIQIINYWKETIKIDLEETNIKQINVKFSILKKNSILFLQILKLKITKMLPTHSIIFAVLFKHGRLYDNRIINNFNARLSMYVLEGMYINFQDEAFFGTV